MKTVISIVLALLILAGLSACTQNNGHIGRRFGMWKLTKIEIDGKTDAAYKGDLFWSFQTGVIQIKEYNGASCYGKCEELDNQLLLDFNNSDDIHPGDSPYYTPPEALHFPQNRLVTLSIIKLGRSDMKLLLHNQDDDKAYVYILKKWG